MSDLVKRLASEPHRLVFGRTSAAGNTAELKAAIERKYVLLKFTETRGGTELGVPLDEARCDLSAANFEKGEGRVHLEGEFKLDYVPVRMVADVDLATLEGKGQLQILERAPARA